MGTGGVVPGVVRIPEEEDSAFENFLEFGLEVGLTVGGGIVGGIMGGGNPYAIQAGAHAGHQLSSAIIGEEPKIPTGLVSLGATAYAQVGTFAAGEINKGALKLTASERSALGIKDLSLSPAVEAQLKAHTMSQELGKQYGFLSALPPGAEAQAGALGAAIPGGVTTSALQDAMGVPRLQTDFDPTGAPPETPQLFQQRLAALPGQQVPPVQPGGLPLEGALPGTPEWDRSQNMMFDPVTGEWYEPTIEGPSVDPYASATLRGDVVWPRGAGHVTALQSGAGDIYDYPGINPGALQYTHPGESPQSFLGPQILTGGGTGTEFTSPAFQKLLRDFAE